MHLGSSLDCANIKKDGDDKCSREVRWTVGSWQRLFLPVQDNLLLQDHPEIAARLHVDTYEFL